VWVCPPTGAQNSEPQPIVIIRATLEPTDFATLAAGRLGSSDTADLRGGWWSTLELHAVDRKSAVDEARLEPPTPGNSTVDLRTAYQWRMLRIDLAMLNPAASGRFRPLPAARSMLELRLVSD
jgi:hypothetical protein